MFYTKAMFEDTNPIHCSNCGESENYKKQETLNFTIQMIHCYNCNNRAELIEKFEYLINKGDKNE